MNTQEFECAVRQLRASLKDTCKTLPEDDDWRLGYETAMGEAMTCLCRLAEARADACADLASSEDRDEGSFNYWRAQSAAWRTIADGLK